MAELNQSVLTQQGIELMNEAGNGTNTIEFIKAVTSADERYASLTEDQLETLTDLDDIKQSVKPEPAYPSFTFKDTDGNTKYTDEAVENAVKSKFATTVPIVFRNQGKDADNNDYTITEDYLVQAVGLYAHDGNRNQDILYSVMTSSTPHLISAYDGNVSSFKIKAITAVGRTDKLNVIVSDFDVVTFEQMNSALSNYVNLDNFNNTKDAIWSDAANHEYKADHASDIGSLNNRFDQYTSSANVLQSNAVDNMTSINNRFATEEGSRSTAVSGVINGVNSNAARIAVEEGTRASAVSGAVVGIDSNATRIATEEHTRASAVGSLATNISNTFQARGQYDGNLLDVALLPDGYYTILNNFKNAPAGFSGYGYFVKKVVGTDFYIELYDNANHHWTNHWGNHKWDGWMQVPDTNGVFQSRGLYQGNLLEIASLPDGYYQLIANTTNAPTGFSGYGIFIKQTVGADYYVTLIQADNTEWKAHTYNGNWNFWVKTANQTDLANLQNQINAIKSKLGM